MKIRTIVFCFVVVANVTAVVFAQDATGLKISGDFEGVGVPGVFTYHATQNALDVEYYSPSQHSSQRYRVQNFDVCSSMAMYGIPHTNQVAIDGSCSSQGGQIYRNIYAWKPEYAKWCLIREVTGEKPDITSGTVAPNEHVARVSGCSEIGANGPYRYESDSKVRVAINEELQRFVNSTHKRGDLKAFLMSMPSYAVSELASYVNLSNVEIINNLCFYLEENGRSYDAIPVLIAIVSKFPDRVVAKINLADAYWDNDLKIQAAGEYREYIDQMKRAGKESRVPKRAFDRLAK